MISAKNRRKFHAARRTSVSKTVVFDTHAYGAMASATAKGLGSSWGMRLPSRVTSYLRVDGWDRPGFMTVRGETLWTISR